MKTLKLAGAIPALVLSLGIVSGANAASIVPEFDSFADLNAATTTDVTFTGSGIPTDPSAIRSFTNAAGDTLLLGLTAHQRFSENPPLTNDGNGTFFATAGLNTPPSDPSGLQGATWNFAWFAEVKRGANSTATLADFALELLYDFDPGANTPVSDHGRLMSSTLEFFGPDQDGLIYQGSQNLAFNFLANDLPEFIIAPGGSFDPFAGGEYTFALRSNLGDVAIQVNVAPIPLPAAGWLLLTAVGGLGLAARRRRKAA